MSRVELHMALPSEQKPEFMDSMLVSRLSRSGAYFCLAVSAGNSWWQLAILSLTLTMNHDQTWLPSL